MSISGDEIFRNLNKKKRLCTLAFFIITLVEALSDHILSNIYISTASLSMNLYFLIFFFLLERKK